MIINKTMTTWKKLITLIAILLCCDCSIQKQEKKEPTDYYETKPDIEEEPEEPIIEKFEHKIHSEYVKSLQVGIPSIQIGEPCISISNNENIQINFDLIQEDPSPVQYEIIHCDINWERSDLMDMEYINGFTTNYIDNYQLSYGPIDQYVHYDFNLPNENVEFLKSGNYIVKIYYENESNNPLMTIKIFVSEQSSTINFSLLPTNDMEQKKYLQAYELSCSFDPNKVDDPYSNLFVNIQQNHQEFDQQWISQPNFIRENSIVYLPNDDRIFNGGNEYRFFDISSFRSGSQKVNKISFEDNSYQIILNKEPKRSYKQYLEYKDLDGKFFIRSYDCSVAETQAEYGIVHFELPMKKISNQDIYIFGQLSNWSTDEKYKMQYDSIKQTYFKNILLKQGHYNYLYVTKDQNGISTRTLEGAHYDANNEYIIKLYYRDPIGLYDRLLAYQVFKINT